MNSKYTRMFHLFALVCLSCAVYYHRDEIWETSRDCFFCVVGYCSKFRSVYSKTKENCSDVLNIYETMYLDNVYIINYSIHHKLYSVHCVHDEKNTKKIEELLHEYNDLPTNKNLMRKIIFAELRGTYGKEDVTSIIKRAQGLQCDFHLGIMRQITPQPTILWDHILYEYDLDSWDVLTLVDSFGHIHNIHMIEDPRIVTWNPEFKLG